jgi:hypothetical protein
VSKMAKCCFWVTTSPRFATFLHNRHTGERNVGYLATVVMAIMVEGGWSDSLAYDIIAELDEYNDRIYSIILWRFSSWPLDKVLAAMQQPFPALKSLYLHCSSAQAVVVPASFLGGSAQSLQSLATHAHGSETPSFQFWD